VDQIKIIGAPQSIYVRTTLMALEEKGVPYSVIPAAPNSTRVRALHPFAKIPVMRHGDLVLFESKAIATYIDKQFNGPMLVPDDPVLAAITEQWISAINTSVFPTAASYMQANVFRKGLNGQRDEGVIAEKLPSIARHIEILSSAVSESGHLVGLAFSLADMFLLPMLAYLRMFPESSAMLSRTGHLNDYFTKHSARESFIRTVPPRLEQLQR
jgi:glutathione S-transferase